MQRPLLVSAITALSLVSACASDEPADQRKPAVSSGESATLQAEAQTFLDAYSKQFQTLYTASSEAEWLSNTHIVEGDETNSTRTKAANEAMAAFTGSIANIETARKFLAHKDELKPLQRKQIEKVLFAAADKPQTEPVLVKQRIAAEAAQTEKMYGFTFKVDGQEISPNEIDKSLREEKDLTKRRKIWESSKEVGAVLKPGLIELRRLRNAGVQSLGYHDFFAYMASEYGMTTDELAASVAKINRELRPLFSELHTFARYELAARYGQPVPDLIPADWLPNRWGQDWTALVDVAGFDLDAPMKAKGADWVIHQAERMYTSIGFESLPASFWEKSSLFPVASDAGFKKNTHASAWHIDLDHDVRSLMSVEPDAEWYETTHHELGHIYYYLSYTNPDVPILLREGANRAYHEAVGSMMGLAAMQPRFVQAVGLDTGSAKPDANRLLLQEALKYAVFIPWSAGTMFEFEKALYADNLPPEQWNKKWWELAGKYQGIASPTPRGEEWCDAATKTHINDDPAGYYDYALSFVLLFQLHDHIATKILHESPRDTNYYGRKEVGEFLKSILRPGGTADWRAMLREKTGSDLSAKAMLDYFEPLRAYLAEINRGRKSTLPPM
ncbi:MAG TPA: M2 family metallopeptidase [Planctomycetota bacterium]|nr:M2 family metallopeptidase [Planctomycetota bacterium]